MIRRLLATAVCLSLINGVWAVLPAHAEPPAETVTVPGANTPVVDLALAPQSLYGTDSRDGSEPTAWVRTGASLQTETRLDASGAVDASAGRGLIGRQWFDGSTPTTFASYQAGGRDAMSGPFILNHLYGVFDPSGKRYIIERDKNDPIDIFGTGQLWSNLFVESDGQDRYVLAGVEGGQRLKGAWGPWVHGFKEGSGTFVQNWRTRDTAYLAPRTYVPTWGIGDGILVTHDATRGIIQVFDTTNLAKPLAPKFVFDGTPHSIDRNRLAWTTPDGAIKISTFPFGGKTAPMLLGLMHDPLGRSTNKPWAPAFDFSAPLAAGSLVVKNSTGAVVHTIKTPVSPSGSLRLAWNMRDGTGKELPAGGYTWQLNAKDASGRPATRVHHLSGVEGVLTVGPVISVATKAPRYEIPCGETEARVIMPETFGIRYVESTSGGIFTVTATALPGFALTGQSQWQFTKPTRGRCTAPAPSFVDKPGSVNDRLVIPSGPWPVTHYTVNGSDYPEGTYTVDPGESVVVRAHFQDTTAKPIEWRHSYSTTGSPVTPPITTPKDPYSETGEYFINGRKWRTTCEPYSVTRRCRTEIWATQTTQVKDRFVQTNGWVFNNLTYLASPRAIWKGNPLAEANKTWTAADGRKWRTECDTALTGKNGCRSFNQVRVIAAKSRTGGGYTYGWETKWILNNMVRFG